MGNHLTIEVKRGESDNILDIASEYSLHAEHDYGDHEETFKDGHTFYNHFATFNALRDYVLHLPEFAGYNFKSITIKGY